MADSDSWDADNFEPNVPIRSAVVRLDRWEGEDEEEDVKDNWDDEEEEKEEEQKKAEVTAPEKKKISSKIKVKEVTQKKNQELKNKLQETQISEKLSPEEQQAEKLRQKKLQEEADLELAREAFTSQTEGKENTGKQVFPGSGVDPADADASTTVITTNNASGIEAMCPSSKEDFVAFEKLLKDKITQFEKSVHYSSFLESLFRELCISLEVDDLKKISNSLSVLLTEKQRQEKEKKANKKKKKGVLPGGGFKANMKDDFDFGDFDGGYGNDYDDFM
ncbi:eukaryotic translation initiation factor 3 subunit J-B-like isoform X1 [Myxocyprinus asiaticus]|uniref:eukaryotic translation initiation factor 3 subunit J-B-like isoform X1 n=1 Tax=Myxocyprinus asiaticus TaxID=70543 RepID=UPI002222BA19|nr:eukaryotic translation initiation factor 3 subunit J-B-like isoform X1 [Myxocyprinus asiaticus]